MNEQPQGNHLYFAQAGTGPTVLFLHDDPSKQEALFRDCSPLAASNLRVVVALITPTACGSTQVLALMKLLGIGRAVVIAISSANYTLIDLLEKHPDRIAAASFVADQALARSLRGSTDAPHIHALLHSGHRTSVAKAVARARRPASAYNAARAWAARIVGSCRAGLRNCAALLAGLELPGLIQLDDDDDEEVLIEAQ